MVMPPNGEGPTRESDTPVNVHSVARADLPPCRLVATLQTSERKAITLEMHDGIVAADAAHQLL
jgi:hypothetical protein